MTCKYILLLGLCLPSIVSASVETTPINTRDLYLGEAFYYASQDNYLEAITRLDRVAGQAYSGKPNPNPLHFQFGNTAFAVSEFEMAYRMPKRAAGLISTVLANKVDQSVRNEAAYRLAQIYLQDGEAKTALQSIEQISGKVPENIRDDELFLRAQIYLANGMLSEATNVLLKLQSAKNYRGFATYNLGVALIKSGKDKAGQAQLDKAGRVSGDDEVTSAIRDKANLALGYRLIDAKQPAQAREYFERVRLNGPFSNNALLGLGWINATQGKFESALAPWTVLSKRSVSDKTVQESMLAVPYAYAKLNLPGKAALFYGRAVEGFGQELTKLDAATQSVRSGKYLLALQVEGLQPDKNWIAKISALPETPETYYLLDLLASKDFQESVKSYLDLSEILSRLKTWDENLDAYSEMVNLQRQYYATLLPSVDKQFTALDNKIKMRLKQRQSLEDQLSDKLVSPQYEYYLSDAYKKAVEAYSQLQLLDDDVKNLNKIYASFVKTRQAITQNYQEDSDQLRQLKTRVHAARQKVEKLMVRQAQLLEEMAVNEFDQRRRQLQEYQAHARFALAESYERASKMQAPKSGTK